MRLFFLNSWLLRIIIIILSYPQNKPFDTSNLEEAKTTGNKEAEVWDFLRGKKGSVTSEVWLLKFSNFFSDKRSYLKGLEFHYCYLISKQQKERKSKRRAILL